jgi:protein ImuB
MKRVLCVWFPNWPIQRLTAAQPALEDACLALHAERGSRGSFITACSAVAAGRGIAPGMLLAEAAGLAGGEAGRRRASSPPQPPLFLLHDPAADLATLRELARACQRFTPRVSLEEAPQPAALFLDIAGCGHLYGGEERLQAEAAADLQARRYHPRLGIADTLGAAWALARYGRPEGRRPPRAARGRSPAPRPQLSLLAAIDPQLSPLPVAALRLPEEVLRKLHRLGLTTIGHVLDLPRATLPSRFGNALLERVDQLLGNRPEVTTPVRPLEPVRAEWSFDDPVDDLNLLAEALRRLLAQVAADLGPHRSVQQVECGWEEAAAGTVPAPPPSSLARSLSLSLTRPTTSASHLQELVRLQLERLPPRGPVRRAWVVAQPLPRPAARQQSLLGADDAPPREPLAELLDRLRNRWGAGTVLQPRLVDDWLPERSIAWEDPAPRAPAAGRKPDEGGRSPAPSAELFPLLRLYAQPLPLEVVLHRDRPLRLRWSGQEERVAVCTGPQRVETGWWRRRFIRRDYYRLAMASGRQLWVYAQQEGDHWRWFAGGE